VPALRFGWERLWSDSSLFFTVTRISPKSANIAILGFSLATATLHAAGILIGLSASRFSEKLVRLTGIATMTLGVLMMAGA